MLPWMSIASQPGRRGFLITAAGSVAALASGCNKKEAPPPDPPGTPDLIVVGRVLPLHRLHKPCDAVAVTGATIAALGSREEVLASAGRKTRVLDLRDGLVIPGLVDAHGHLVNLGAFMEQVDLRGARSPQEVVDRLKAAEHPGEWIQGRGWDQNLWASNAMPTHRVLSEAFPDRAVWLTRVDGHAGWCNAHLMRTAGLDDSVENPAGGEFLRDETGALTGVLVDAAMDRIEPPAANRKDLLRQMTRAQRHALSMGLTGVHEMGVSRRRHAVFQKMAKDGGLRLRVSAYADRDWFEEELLTESPRPVNATDHYHLIGAKLYADGALGSRGAALLGSYLDRPGHSGAMLTRRKDLERLAIASMQGGWQLATHAIGDRAIRTVLDAYGVAYQRVRNRDHRFRIEHCQIVSLKDLPRFSSLAVIASMQPTHATSDMAWVPKRIPANKLEGAYAWRRFLDTGVHLPFGSDFPVERVDPRLGLYAAMTRQRLDGEPSGGWLPDQRLDLLEAIRGFTRQAAFAAKREAHLGALAPGMQADLTCFAGDLREMTPREITKAPIAATIIGGKICFEA